MDAKDLRTESALSERNNDGSKYSQSGGIALHCDRNKSYQDIGSNSLAKVDVQSARPCAVIGPDRVVPPTAPNEAYLKKGAVEPWPCMDNAYLTRRPPEYPHKLANYQNPTRNISPRQTFQENMQRIMVPPSYNSVKISDDTNYVQMSDRSNALPKNIKINVPPEAKFCDYTVYPANNEQKNVRNAEMCMSSVNPTLTRTAPHGWPPGSVNIRPTRPYGAPELYQYQEYPSCAGPRPVVSRPNRTVPEEPGYVYAEPFYHQEGNIRFKPYPTAKDRFPQQRYEYIGNYTNSFHPPPAFPTHKYELQKTVPPHPYQPYPPIKYLERVPEPAMEGYQRNQQGSYNIPYRNQLIHPNYGPVLGNCPQNKIHSYPPDAHIKTLGPNKLPFENNKGYIEYENGRPKMYPTSDSYLVNEMGRVHSMKSQVIMPNYPTHPMHNIPPNPYYKKDNQQIKNYEYLQAHFRGMDPNMNMHNPMIRHPSVFSPNTSAISPSDSSTSNDTSQTLGTSQEDCGYVSQSSTASVRSIDSGINRIPNDYLRKYYDSRFGPIIRTAPMMSKLELNSNSNSKEKKNIDVRQFLQMWNEGDEETEENSTKEIIIQTGPKSDNNFIKAHEVISQSNQEQLYVLGLVNVPSEELGKYEHIQKVSKLPENIKGYNHIELLNQFEEAIESSNMSNYKTSAPKDYQMPSKVVPSKLTTGILPPRPLSPLDVEAKISQSVIHKEVGCNFEIKPCSPKMLNVEVATPVQNILAERAIEKVANPVMLKSPRLNNIDENMDCNIIKRKEHRININNEPVRIPSCKMVNTQFSNNNNIDTIKNGYSLQDLESNSGLCLASLPRLDNDIELNFPEVNQQFINANKGDPSASSTLRDLPSLELLDQSESQTKNKLNDTNSILNQVNDTLKSPSIIDSEKEFSKLSKYRKTKTHSSDSKENQTHVMSVMNAARTDSVIIKNPENTKNFEQKPSFSPNCSNKQDSDVQQVPINLTSQGNILESICKSPTNKSLNAIRCKKNDASIEIAIDFSLNKNSINNHIESVEIKNSKETEILMSNNVEENHSILENELPTFSNYDQNIQNSSLNSPLKSSESETASLVTNDKHDLNIIEKSQFEEMFSDNKCTLPVATAEEQISIDNTSLPVANASDISNIDSNSLLPIEFVIPSNELLQTNETNTNYLLDIDKDNDSEDTNLQKPNNNLLENNLNDSNLENNDLDQKDDTVKKIEEININTKFCSSTQKIKEEVVDSELNNEEGFNNNKTADSSPMEDTQNMYCNPFDLTNEDILDPTTYQSNNTKQSIDSDIDLTSVNNIVNHNQDDCLRETDHQKSELNLSSLSNIISNDLNATEQDHNLISSPSKSVDLHSPKSYKSDFVDHETDSDLKLLCPKDTTQSNISEKDVEFIPCSNDTSNNTPNDYVCEVSEQTTLTLISSNITTTPISIIDDEPTSARQSISELNLSSPSTCNIGSLESNNDLSINNDTSKLEERIHNPTELSSTVHIHKENMLIKVVQDVSETRETIKYGIEEGDKYKVRYLSYGSKEMYSPWIQKLVLFCEGNIYNTVNVEVGLSNTYAPMDVETEQISKSCNFGLLPSKLDEKTLVIENNRSDSRNLSDFSVTKEYSCLDNICEGDQAAENEDNNLKECDRLCNDISSQESDGLISPKENTHEDAQEIKHIFPDTSASSLVNDEDINYDKIKATISESEGIRNCLSPETHEQWDNQSNCSDKMNNKWEKESNCNEEISQECDNKSNSNNDTVPKELENLSTQNEALPILCNTELDSKNELIEQRDNQYNQNEVISDQPNTESDYYCHISELSDEQSNLNDEIPERWDKQSSCSEEFLENWTEETKIEEEIVTISNKQSNCSNIISDQGDKESNNSETILTELDRQADCSLIEVVSSIIEEDGFSSTKVQTSEHPFLNKQRQPLKRSLSDSALNVYNNSHEHIQQDNEENVQFIWPFKRRKIINNDSLAQDLCNIIQNNRRNSISTIYNEENVSFCILIDNDCIITEEESDDQDKICYTELPEECLADVQNECTKEEEATVETMTEAIPGTSSPLQEIEENICEYTDSFIMQEENQKLEESWVEDVACVETVISDDFAEDIEISGPVSPKDDILSDNDESGVFSSSEHTDKVRYIYGDKMCNDDAQFVETLYNTPQMDVNKTLVSRETMISGEYYDNDSLEKILSESHDQDSSPAYTEPVYSPGIGDVEETVENKENMVAEIIPQLQNRDSGIDLLCSGIDTIHHENGNLCELSDETQDDTVHSCESSIDNVFTYKDNNENTNYTSSSPEVSSTTSEEKKSAILLKITNYQGSRISQVNDTNIDSKRPSCKFTEDKDYVQSHSNFATHRPLLTKAAQKYIPPLKESMRDLKVKLSLPQHSLIKLKQLKISKDEPKVCKQNNTVPKMTKKPKPKFEDVLKSIDEIQIKMHKEKNKKSKKSIPKVVIKKSENGSHYASTSNKDEFNPDLTGRKWQPWVFIEKNHFIDKMAIKKKNKAIYSHRKRTYVLAEKFQKYKSVNSAKFVISPPISDCPSTGLKYTIRLKHSY